MSLEDAQCNSATKENVILKKNNNETVIKQYIASIICSILAYMDGAAIAWTSSALPQLETGDEGGWVGGAFCLGALVSSPFFGIIADSRGRKAAGCTVALCFLINWILILSSREIGFVLTARVFAGAGASGAITVPYLYNTEVATPRLRAVLGGMLALFYALGILIAYALGPSLSYDAVAWIYVGLCLLFFPLWWTMPESPAQLILKDKPKEALKVLTWLRGSSQVAEEALEHLILQQAGSVKTASLRSFFKDRAAMKAFWICAVMASVQSFCGLLAVHAYAETIFSRAGGVFSPLAGTMIYGSLMVIGALVPQAFGDRAPRKVLLASSTLVMALAMGAMGAQLVFPSETSPVPPIALGVSVFCFSIGLGSILFVTMSEIFTDENRGVGSALLVMIIWTTDFILLLFFAKVVEAFGDHIVFFFFAAVCLFGSVFCMIFLPETRGRSPQEVVAILLGKKEVNKMDDIFTLESSAVANP